MFAGGHCPTLRQDVEVAGSLSPCNKVQLAGSDPRCHSQPTPLGSKQGDSLGSPSSNHQGDRASLQAAFYPQQSSPPGDCLSPTAGAKSPPSPSKLPPLPPSKQSLPLPLPPSKGSVSLLDSFPRPRLSQQLLRAAFLGLSRCSAGGPRDFPSFLGLSRCSAGWPRDLPRLLF